MKRTKRLRIVSVGLSSLLTVAAAAFPIITDVVETGGDNEPTDTVTAKWTGVTFVNGVANEPIPGTPADAPYTVGFFENLAPAMVDRNHRYYPAADDVPIPDYLIGLEYIMIGNDNKDNAGFRLDVTVSQPAIVYLLIDNRVGDDNNANPPDFSSVMTWVMEQGFRPKRTGQNRLHDISIPDEVGIDESADNTVNQWFSVYWKIVPAGTFSLFEQNNGGSRNMYGVVVGPAPTEPFVGASATPVRIAVTVDDYGLVNLQAQSARLVVDGQVVQAAVSKDDTMTVVRYTLPAGQVFEAGSTHVVVLQANDDKGKSYEWTREVIVPQYPTLPPEWAVSTASVPGMNVDVYMISSTRGPGDQNSLANAEMQIARGYIDPATGQPYQDLALEELEGLDIQYVNWAQVRDAALTDPFDIDDTPADGPDNFNSARPAGNPIPNQWIPGTLNYTQAQINNVVAQVTCYLYLKKGYYQMGVNSDDGFRVSVAWGQPEIGGLTLGLFGTGRGAADTIFDFYVAQDGYYPFRLLWWEGSGDASVEWFSVDPYTGQKLLINGPQPGSIKAYRTAPDRAHLVSMVPAIGWTGLVSPGMEFKWILEDGGATAVDVSSVKLLWEGNEVPNLPIQRSGKRVIVRWPIPQDALDYGLRNYSGEFRWADTGGLLHSYEFTVRGVKDWAQGEVQARLIVNVVETGGDAEPTDTILAQWTGQTFVNGVADEPRVGSAADASYTVGLFVEGAPAYVDRAHIWTRATPELPIPSYLLNGEYIMVGNDNKDNASFRLDITVSQPVMAYLLIDNRLGDSSTMDPPTLGNGTMDWVIRDGWEPVRTGANPFGNPEWPDMIGIDESADGTVNGYASIYRKQIPAGTFSTYECITGNNMYGVVITKVPAAPVAIKGISLTQDGKVRIEWEGVATLQVADEVTGPWSDVTGASSPFIFVPDAKKKFFRLRR